MNPYIVALSKILLAAALGALVGIDRERKHKPIGLRTNVLIASFAALVMVLAGMISHSVGGDVPSRLAAALIQGLGFLGAGAILHGRGAVLGLTTAAVLLAVAGIGMAAGAGQWIIAVSVTALVLLVLVVLEPVESLIHRRCKTMTLSFEAADPVELISEINRVLGEQNVRVHTVSASARGQKEQVEFQVCTTHDLDNTILARLFEKGVRMRDAE